MERNSAMHLLPENIINLSAANTQRIHLPEPDTRNIVLDVLRLDKIDPVISGNKWFKLKYYLQEAIQHPQKPLLTFGGAWSNHIVATAAAANKTSLKSIGIIRGERPAILSGALLSAADLGMQLVFKSRQEYNQKKDPAFIKKLMEEYGDPLIIPEGGAGEPGIKGAAEIGALADISQYTHLICAVGTGTLLRGLIAGSLPGQQIIGIPVLKGFGNQLPAIVTGQQPRVHILPDYHFGGYAKKDELLLAFMNQLYAETGMPTDFVYTGKLFFSIIDLIKKGYFPNNSRLLAIHSGGLQGNNSLLPGTLIF